MKILASIVIAFMVLAAALVAAGQLGFLQGQAPGDLGVKAGRLKPPSETPNRVSSQASMYPTHPQLAYASIAPFTFASDGLAAMEKLAAILKKTDACIVVTHQVDYLYAQCSTPLLRFTDDVEFWLDRNANLIHVRSASRLGRGDLGVNRKRVERLRAQFQEN